MPALSIHAYTRTHLEYAKIHEDAIWRFYIDFYRQITPKGKREGDKLFDVDEPGYIKAMLKAHQYMNKIIHESLTAEHILNLYHWAMEGVKKTNLMDFDEFGKFRNNDVSGFWLMLNSKGNELSGNVSPEGLREFLKEIIQNNNPNNYKIYKADLDILSIAVLKCKEGDNGLDNAVDYLHKEILAGKTRFVSPSMSHSEIKKKVKQYIDEYHLELSRALSEEKKLECVIKLCQNLERLHPFIDGNCRTLVMLTLNCELIKDGFPPTMLENPNRFDFFSIDQLKNEIKLGWENAKQFQSQVTLLPTYKKLYIYADVLHKEYKTSFFPKKETFSKAQKLENLLQNLKKLSLEDAIDAIEDNLNIIGKGRGVTTKLLNLSTPSKKMLMELVKEIKDLKHQNEHIMTQ
ncbi:hypothetical protein TUM19329_02390 [Legionella antarctica]|uniref:Fido domain-containing protein n=1 Tax=Legionella antarctica TaxID=2708020 RepID=A0A6F8T0A3_9GAMM|nr:Fic family protein [Legionella antarctica]BCA93878.1 hypothetical protein TUM19329_02390 [Legionella antarctica]